MSSEKMRIDVRPARPEQASELAPLVCAEAMHAQRIAGYYELRPDFDWESYTRARIGSPGRELLVAQAGDAVVGYLEVRVRRYASRPTPSGWKALLRRRAPDTSLPLAPLQWGIVEGCYVDERYRRHGVGQALFAAAKSWFQRAGVRRVEAAALVDGDAVKFWEASGFRTFRALMSVEIDPPR